MSAIIALLFTTTRIIRWVTSRNAPQNPDLSSLDLDEAWYSEAHGLYSAPFQGLAVPEDAI
jgi:hypothetical protein